MLVVGIGLRHKEALHLAFRQLKAPAALITLALYSPVKWPPPIQAFA